ncbi:hypothetical protein [Ruegeria sp. EL01]|uniref:hypothetical protein n=1 Tax=Ruegeria sp. EL01 TaxID=2107578 RepID=UPI0013C4BF07|nr:hypothetical protein [Ruegeria sp. EL01]
MTVRTKTTIFNAALLRTGHSDVTEGEGSGLWRALEANYDEIVRVAFEEGNGSYPFGKVRRTLTGRSEGDFGYSDSFVIGSDILHITEVFLDEIACSDIHEPWEVDAQAGTLLINASSRTVEVEGIKEGLEYTWSGKFAIGIQRKCEAVIKDVEEEFGEASAKDQDADFLLMKAGVKGSRNRSKSRVFNKGRGRITTARRTRSTRVMRSRS